MGDDISDILLKLLELGSDLVIISDILLVLYDNRISSGFCPF
jgi:hypothetical protein